MSGHMCPSLTCILILRQVLRRGIFSVLFALVFFFRALLFPFSTLVVWSSVFSVSWLLCFFLLPIFRSSCYFRLCFKRYCCRFSGSRSRSSLTISAADKSMILFFLKCLVIFYSFHSKEMIHI